ncbi:MAG: hypothetical protein ACLPYZ_14245 [Limisphaerales bacterium]
MKIRWAFVLITTTMIMITVTVMAMTIIMTTTTPIPTPTHTGKRATITRTETPLASIGFWRCAKRFWKRMTGWRSATAAFSMRAACWC